MIYTKILRPLFFIAPAETIHYALIVFLKVLFRIPGFSALVTWLLKSRDQRLKKKVFGLEFANPVGLAAGFDKNAELYNELAAFGFSHIEIGTVTPKPQPGNLKPRLFRLKNDKALINRMGFNNNGLDAAVEQLKKRKTSINIGGNIGKNTGTPNSIAVDDYIKNFNGLFDYVDYFVVNVSCPNITDLRELQDQDALTFILNKLQEINSNKPKRKPILLKVSPDLNIQQLDEVIEIVRNTGIDGVVATNTTLARHNLVHDVELSKHIGSGGLSGKPLKDQSTEVIRYLAMKSNKAFPIIGVGGIFSADDAIEKLDAGADLIQIYTGFIYQGPLLVKRINQKLLNRMT